MPKLVIVYTVSNWMKDTNDKVSNNEGEVMADSEFLLLLGILDVIISKKDLLPSMFSRDIITGNMLKIVIRHCVPRILKWDNTSMLGVKSCESVSVTGSETNIVSL